MEGHCSTGQSPQWALVPIQEEEEEEEEEEDIKSPMKFQPDRNMQLTMKIRSCVPQRDVPRQIYLLSSETPGNFHPTTQRHN